MGHLTVILYWGLLNELIDNLIENTWQTDVSSSFLDVCCETHEKGRTTWKLCSPEKSKMGGTQEPQQASGLDGDLLEKWEVKYFHSDKKKNRNDCICLTIITACLDKKPAAFFV